MLPAYTESVCCHYPTNGFFSHEQNRFRSSVVESWLPQPGTWPWNQFDCDRAQRLASSSLVFLVSWFVRKWGIVMDYGDLAQNGNFKREKRMENYEFSRLLRSSLWNPHISTPIWGQTQEEWGRNATACAWTGKTCPILAVCRCRGGSHWWRRVSGWNVAMLSCPAIQGLFWWHRLIWAQWIWMCPSWWNNEGFRSSSRNIH
jgi:hypothetical protein